MKKQSARTNLPTREPITIYRKSRAPILLIIVAIILVFALSFSKTASSNGVAGNPFVVLCGALIIGAGYITWNILRTKVERYQDAVVVYSDNEHNVFYFTDIALFLSESIESSYGRSYTKYTLQRSDGVTMSIPDMLESGDELISVLKEYAGQPKDAVQEAIDKLNRGEKMVFSQFTVTAQGITAENGEFRAWSDIFLATEVRRTRAGSIEYLAFKESNKSSLTGKAKTWAPVPMKSRAMLEKITRHFQTTG